MSRQSHFVFWCVAAGALLGPTTIRAAELAVDARDYPGSAWSPYLVGRLAGGCTSGHVCPDVQHEAGWTYIRSGG